MWCARQIVSGGPAEALPADALDGVDWADFLRESQRHSCLALAWRSLQAAPALPAAVRTELETAFAANAVRNLRLAGELVTTTRRLAAVAVPAVSWKGPVLAERAYGDLRLRQFFDLDVLVRRADLTAAIKALGELGYRPQQAMTTRQQAAYVDHMGELELVRDSDGTCLELHTAIVPTYFGRGRSADELFAGTRPARVARAEVLALDPVDELEALCVHGSKHRWERLEWIVDVAMLGRLLTSDDWATLYAGARRRGARRMVDTAVLLARTVTRARFAPGIVEAAEVDPTARRLASISRRRLFDPRAGRGDELLFHVQMWDTPLDQLRYLARVPTTPSVADWEFLELPRVLAPLYVFVRPMRMAVEVLRHATRDRQGVTRHRGLGRR